MIYGHVEHVAYYEFHSLAVVRPRSVCVLVEFRESDLSNRADSRFAEVISDFFFEFALADKSVYKVDNLFVYDFVEYVFFDYLIDRCHIEIGEIIAYRSLFAYRLDKIGYHVFTFLAFDFEKLIYGYVEQIAYYEFHSLAVVRPRSVSVLVKFCKSDLSNFTQLCIAEIVIDNFGRLFLVVLYDFDDVYDRIVEKFGKYRFFGYLTYIVVL